MLTEMEKPVLNEQDRLKELFKEALEEWALERRDLFTEIVGEAVDAYFNQTHQQFAQRPHLSAQELYQTIVGEA